MTRRKLKHKKPTYAELDKMERIKSILECEGSKMNTVPIVQNKADVEQVKSKQINTPYISYGKIKIALKDIKISDHATKQTMIREHLKDEGLANSFLKNTLLISKPIGETFDENGKPAILFAKKNKGIYLSPDLTTIVTFIPQEKTYSSVKTKVVQFLEKEVKKLDRIEKRKVKEFTELKLVTNIEIAELEYEIHKRSKDKAFVNAATARINAIRQSISEYHEEILNIQREKTHTSKSIVVYG